VHNTGRTHQSNLAYRWFVPTTVAALPLCYTVMNNWEPITDGYYHRRRSDCVCSMPG
jgi:hypothetical protein